MKWIGIVLLSIGVAISAAYGSRLTPTIRSQLSLRGRAQFLEAQTAARYDEYCEAQRATRQQPMIDGCVADGPSEQPAIERCAEGRDRATDLAAIERCRLETLRASTDTLPPAVAQARDTWLRAFDEAIDPAARAAALRPAQPADRVSEWYANNGLPFLLGLAFVVAGAVVGRIAVRREASSESDAPTDAKFGAPRDLGALLAEAQRELEALRDRMRANTSPSGADHDELKDRLHEITLTKIELIVAAGPRVQARYGMANYAELFGPFSSAERYINRAWSALVDRHWPEALASVARAHDDLAATRAILDKLAAR